MTAEQIPQLTTEECATIMNAFLTDAGLIELFKTSHVDMREVLRANSIRDMLTADEVAFFDSMKKHANEPQA